MTKQRRLLKVQLRKLKSLRKEREKYTNLIPGVITIDTICRVQITLQMALVERQIESITEGRIRW